ncbi:hypothetical protein GQX73_g1103 [Xylaria multiplex]|uniref:AB hydrolase-1 domain-containing protein n=1 Tax=Xylaria multiplex TaxID=323545 RepID=A0A7C8MSA1_9PEZI|nr:hypothetical protein GQX73_g1103 [Xylaria multiplex]
MSYAIDTWGVDDAPPILLSNPLGTTLAVWDHVVPQLLAMGFNVLRYDHPGHGESDVPQDLSSTTFESLADDVHHLLRHLSVPILFAWIGVSLGAATSIVFTMKYPRMVENLIVCDTISCSPINEGAVDYFQPRLDAIRKAGNLDAYIGETLNRWFGRPWLDANPNEEIRMRDLMHDVSVAGIVTCCSALRSQSFDLRGWASAAGGHVNHAQLLIGQKDTALRQSMEELRRDIEGGLRNKTGDNYQVVFLEDVENAGHVCFIDGLDSFMHRLRDFLQIL